MSELQTEPTKTNRQRWVRFKDLSFSRTFANKLIKSREITSVKYLPPNSKKGIILIDSDSIDRYLEKLAQSQGTLAATEVAK